ncbi:MAG: family 78 glycoside hydrolase catalytic domain [Phycisphaerales bacterium]|nr:family 78 glycoside hydrolase catalytic domain [Phycisphaerales bacterium]
MRHARVCLLLPSVLLLAGCTNPRLEISSSTNKAAGLKPSALRCEYLVNPLGIDNPSPRLSWLVNSSQRGQFQSAYQILVATSLEKLEQDVGDLWNTDKVPGDRTTQIEYQGLPLTSRTECYWKVRVWDRQDTPSRWSDASRWTMGLLKEEDWNARWVSYQDDDSMDATQHNMVLQPARYYRRTFETSNKIRRATVYATSLGNYELNLNGRKVSDWLFTPGWSDYKERVYYNTFDVTDQVRQGSNTLGAIVADGWYSGYVGYGKLVGYGPDKCGRYFYGKTPALLVQLEIEYQDGSTETVATGCDWKVSTGPLLEADILMGETYDARLEMADWDMPGFDDSTWANAVPAETNPEIHATFYDRAGQREINLSFERPARMQAYSAVPVRKTQTLKPISITEPTPGTYIFNLGQNTSGVVRLQTKGPAGTSVKMRFGEMLHPDGRLMTENLREARATNTYILKGDPRGEIYQPKFTYHGFQYVELTGLAQTPDLDTVTGIVIHSDTPLTSSFSCSDPIINQLFSNIVWTQRANFFEVPTDCPQRDERLGWTGDAQIYIKTASYNADVAAFFTKWFDDLEEAQLPSGAFPDYAPYPMAHGKTEHGYATAWTDAGIICPHAIYQMYDDTRVINRHYEAMRRFMKFRQERSPDFRGINVCNAWGDWLSLGSQTPIEFIDMVYFAISTRKMSKMAQAVGRDQDAAEYERVYNNIQKAFAEQYLTEEGTLLVDNQTGCVLALSAGLVPEELIPAIQQRLVTLLEDNQYRMTTGFLGTKELLFVLSDAGHNDIAARLLQSRQFPSWGYSVANGATSIWERWNSYTIENGFGDAGMNSFSHYAFGAVGQWMFEKLAGIDMLSPGFKTIRIKPHIPSPDGNPDQEPIRWVNARYDSIHGPIAVSWERQKNGLDLTAIIPTNTNAVIYIPAQSVEQVSESGIPIDKHPDLVLDGFEESFVRIKAASGKYKFSVRAN